MLLYGNCWVTAWTANWAPEERTWSALEAWVKAIHLCNQKGWSFAAFLLDLILRADCHWGRISCWRSLLCGIFFWAKLFGYKRALFFFFVIPFHCYYLRLVLLPLQLFYQRTVRCRYSYSLIQYGHKEHSLKTKGVLVALNKIVFLCENVIKNLLSCIFFLSDFFQSGDGKIFLLKSPLFFDECWQ